MAITAPVLERLHELAPDWRITVSSSVAGSVLRSRIQCPFELVPDELDFGLRMNRDLSVDAAATIDDYAAIHADWDRHVAERAAWLAGSRCDLLLANISYLNIEAADRSGIPVIALSPLNWADLYRHYAPDSAACRAVFEQMVNAYNRAGSFLAPRPCMPMPYFDKVEVIPPVAQLGRDRRARLRELFDLDASTKLVLLALGGQEADFGVAALPVLENICWVVDDRRGLTRDDILSAGRPGLAFPDLLASCDLLVAKPGYGAFTEAACLGKPVVYMRRAGWPEEIYLIEWLRQQVPCREAPRGDAPALEGAVRELIEAPPLQACAPDGVDETVRRILGSAPRH